MLPVFAEAGLLALPFPEKYGGLAADRLTVILVEERLAQHGGIAAIMFGQVVDFGGMSLLSYGTEEQSAGICCRVRSRANSAFRLH